MKQRQNMNRLATELKTFGTNLPVLLGASEGKFVLIREEEIVGVFDNQMDAVSAGYGKFGNVPFLVKQILKVDMPISFVSLTSWLFKRRHAVLRGSTA